MTTLSRPRDELFCQYRAEGLSQAKAYTKAGFTSKIPADKGCKKNGEMFIKQRIDEIIEENAKAAVAELRDVKKDVLGLIDDLIERFMQAVPVQVNGKANGQWKFDGANALKAIHMKGVEHGMFVTERKTRHGQIDPLENMTPEEQITYIAETVKALGPGALKEFRLAPIIELVGSGEESEKSEDSATKPLRAV